MKGIGVNLSCEQFIRIGQSICAVLKYFYRRLSGSLVRLDAILYQSWYLFSQVNDNLLQGYEEKIQDNEGTLLNTLV
jgi:hypothetical protein